MILQTISKQERYEKGMTANSLTYGEIEFKAIAQVFGAMRRRYKCFHDKGGVFIDIGSVSQLSHFNINRALVKEC
jgi:hypothetical protein